MKGAVALAGAALETFAIGNDDVAASVLYQSLVLKCLHLRESFLGQRQLVAADAVGTLQQGAREPRNATVYSIAGCDLLGLRQ